MPKSISPRPLTVFHLKLLAVTAMLADHIAAVVLIPLGAPAGLSFALRAFGRLAFPLYCFLLVEGFVHTHSRRKYALRLGLFALLSEIPFDLAFNSCVLEPADNNVFFTLLLGFLLLWATETLRRAFSRRSSPHSASSLPAALLGPSLALLLAAAYGLAWLLRADYGFSGVLCVLFLWLLREYPSLGLLSCTVVLVYFYGTFSFFALLAIPPVLLYGGQKGPGRKYAFYFFYSLHLLALYAIRYWLII